MYSIAYFHTTLGKTNLEPINTFRKLFNTMDEDIQRHLKALNVVHPGMYLKTTVYLKKKLCKNNILMRHVQWKDTLMDFFDSLKGETILCQRIIGSLPHEIHQVYL